MASRWKITLVLSIPIIILSGFLIKNTDTEKALKISDRCFDNRVECLNTQIISYISKNPKETGNIFNVFWELEKSGKLSDDPRIFSDIVHEAGMTIADSDMPLDKALIFCGTAFKQGCIHGVIMEYIDSKYVSEIEPKTFFDFCRTVSNDNNIYINCLHGVGHELAAKNKSTIQEVLHLCDPLSNKERFACASGVLMEYSKGTAGSGFHPHMPIGKKELPCTEIDDTYKPVCYASAGSYRQYEPSQEDFNKSYDFCFNSPTAYVNDCLTGLSERAILSTAENQQKLKLICESMNNNELKSKCTNSIQKLMEDNSI